MKKNIYLIGILAATIFISSCNSDDDATTVSASNFSASVDENSATGTVLGTVTAATNNGIIAYSLSAQSVANALSINATTGAISINDEAAFDYETNTNITATLTATSDNTSDTSDVTITINNMDDLAFLLATSLTDYNNAANGDWIEITETEYNNLADNLNQVTTAGLKESLFEQDLTSLSPGANGYTVSAKNDTDTELMLANNEFVFAFKYVNKAGVANRTNDQVKISSNSDISLGYSNLGTALPSHSGNGVTYFILKGNTTKNTAEGFINFYSSNSMGYNVINGYTTRFASGNANTLNGTDANTFRIQALTTIQKQW